MNAGVRKEHSKDRLLRSVARLSWVAAMALVLMVSATGCLAVGYSSSGGWFLWPGGIGLVFLILLVLFLMRRRR